MDEILAAQQQALQAGQQQAQAIMQQNTQLISQAVNQSLPAIWWMELEVYAPLIILFCVAVWLILWKLNALISAVEQTEKTVEYFGDRKPQNSGLLAAKPCPRTL